MTNYAFCRRNERPSIWERVHPFIIIIIFFFFFFFLPRHLFSAASSLLLFSRLDMYIHADYIRRVSGEKMTSRLFLADQREETQARSLVLSSCNCASCHCRVDLRGPREFKKKNKKKHRLSFLSFFPASLDLSDLPRF